MNNDNISNSHRLTFSKKNITTTNSSNIILSNFTDEQLHDFQNTIGSIINSVSDTITKQMKQLHTQLELACEAINNFYTNPRTLHAAEYLGNRGWCIDLCFAPRTIIEIYVQKPSQNELNQYMLQYYTHSNTLDKTVKRLLTCSKIEKWHNSIAQAYKAYNNNLYIASICTLLPVFEGILFEFWDNKWQKKNEHKTNATYLSKQLLNECKPEKNFIKYLSLLSLNNVIKQLYNSHTIQFTVPETQKRYKFNRHGIVHGRIPMKNNVYDALKLFNYIAAIVAFL